LDTALADVLLSRTNLVYDVAPVLAGLALADSVHRGGKYLLYVDARVRREGFDLRFQIEQLLNVGRFSNRPIESWLLALGTFLLLAGPARADDDRLGAIRGVRQELGKITREVREAKPVPRRRPLGAAPAELANRLEEEGGQGRRFRWFDQAVEGFTRRKAAEAVQVLGDLDRRLALVEESLAERARGQALSREEIKKLLPEQGDDTGGGPNARDRRRRPRRKSDP